MKIAACFGRSASPDPFEIARRMAETMVTSPLHTVECVRTGGGAIGCVRTSDRLGAVPALHQSECGNVLAIHGVPIAREGSVAALLSRAAEAGASEAAGILSEFEGAFAALHWDAATRRLTVVEDFLGIQPLYLHHHEGVLLVSCELKAMPASGLVEVAPDPGGWGGFVTLGYAVGADTMLAGVRRVRGATITTYDVDDDRLDSREYWHMPDVREGMTLAEADTATLVDAMKVEMQAYDQYGQDGVCFVSGGFDSRLLLLLLRSLGRQPRTLVVMKPGHFGNADGLYGVRVARRFSSGQCEVVWPGVGDNSFGEYLRFLLLNEVATPALSLFIPKVAACVSEGHGAVWDALGPDYSLKSIVHPHERTVFLEGQMPSRVTPRWKPACRIFDSDRIDAMIEGVVAALQEEREALPATRAGLARFSIRNRWPNRTATTPLKVYANHALPLLPATSRSFWNTVCTIPSALKKNNAVYAELFRRHLPEALQLPFCGEKGIHSSRRFAPSVWLRNAWGEACYYARRSRMLPGIRQVRKWLASAGREELPDPLAGIIEAIDPDQPGLDADGVRSVQQAEKPYDRQTSDARKLLFYWQLWHWTMRGDLTPANLGEVLATGSP